ncbi:unnamed protein product [Vitrella brassicaformis CCMP3155]|uniref:Uncharacterized protein n=1 Tax=Vitrella brassicaformis (strain CCMP3155) TaxID=1169540 RepID=A0A0G4FTR3_VITBC|nr:unnamed protein product [Vitrella brassicaformis CCMP3155]|mmetsp:Transcript_10945/g.31733  ORF Transcript_10945/g.31733 Transcript_10945/m.31733 type:complete len:120 (-) Transcript_10945:379-738(-)|eukprot:CEM17810.1 unnamed protein product [Vitrella brassicaformis CCMP3155]
MGLRQNCKKRACSPLPSASPTESDLQPLPKAKRRPTPYEKDEAQPSSVRRGEVLWDPLNKAREGEIVKAAETADDQTGLTMGKRAPRGEGRPACAGPPCFGLALPGGPGAVPPSRRGWW